MCTDLAVSGPGMEHGTYPHIPGSCSQQMRCVFIAIILSCEAFSNGEVYQLYNTILAQLNSTNFCNDHVKFF